MKKFLSDKQRIEFAKQLEYFYEVSHPSWHRVLTFAFLRGLATGFGIFIGGTVIVGLVLWILSLLGHLPLLNDIVDQTQQAIKKSN